MNLRQMEVFRAVMVAGTLTGAARMLHVTQPGISRLLKYLEMHLGVPLFERQANRLVPTPEARALFREIERIYRGVAGVQEFAESLKRGGPSSLRIVSSPSLGLYVVPRAVAELRASFPGVAVSLEILPVGPLTEMLAGEQAEIGVSFDTIDHPSIRCEVLTQTRLVCVLEATHPLAGKKSVALAELAKHPSISFGVETTQGRAVSELFREAGLERQISAQVRIGRAAVSLAAAGVGIAIVDEFTAEEGVRLGLKALPIRPTRGFSACIARNRNAALSRAAAAFCEALKREAARRKAARTG